MHVAIIIIKMIDNVEVIFLQPATRYIVYKIERYIALFQRVKRHDLSLIHQVYHLVVHTRKRETFSERDDYHVFRIKIRLRPLVPTARITRIVALRQVLLDRDPAALHRVVLAPPVRLQKQMDAYQ